MIVVFFLRNLQDWLGNIWSCSLWQTKYWETLSRLKLNILIIKDVETIQRYRKLESAIRDSFESNVWVVFVAARLMSVRWWTYCRLLLGLQNTGPAGPVPSRSTPETKKTDKSLKSCPPQHFHKQWPTAHNWERQHTKVPRQRGWSIITSAGLPFSCLNACL